MLAIIGSPGYSPPPAPGFPVHDGYIPLWGAGIAGERGDSWLGLEHALLAMIRTRGSVPARALAGLASLDAIEAAVLEAMNAPAAGPPEDAVFLPEGQQMDRQLRKAIIDALPGGTTFGFNRGEDKRTWMHVIGPGDSGDPAVTREVLATALASLARPGGEGS